MNLLRQFAGYFAGRILPAIIGMGAVAVYTRVLDPHSFGVYAVLLSVALLSAIGFSWLRVAVLRRLGSSDGMDADFAKTVVALFLGTSVVVSPILAVTLCLIEPGLPVAVYVITIVAALTSAWFDLTCTVLQAGQRVSAYGGINLARALLSVGVSTAMALHGFKEEALLLGFVAGNCAALAVGRIWWMARGGRFDRALSGELSAFGWPATVSGAVSQLSVTFDRTLLSVTAGASAVGLYSVSADLPRQSVSLLIMTVALAGQPLAIKILDNSGREAANKQLRHNAQMMFGLALPAVVGLAILAQPIADTLFGVGFRGEAGPLIGMMAVAAGLYGIRSFYFDQAFELARNTRPQAFISIGAVAVGMGLSAVLIPRYSAIGAAWSAIAMNVVGTSMSAVLGRTVYKMPISAPDLCKTAVATLAMALTIIVLPTPHGAVGLVRAMVLGTVSYVCILSAFSARARVEVVSFLRRHSAARG